MDKNINIFTMIKIMTKEHKIPGDELNFLINKFFKEKKIIRIKNNYYKLIDESS